MANHVRVANSRTLNLGNYESARAEVEIQLEFENEEELFSTKDRISEKVTQFLNEELDKLTGTD